MTQEVPMAILDDISYARGYSFYFETEGDGTVTFNIQARVIDSRHPLGEELHVISPTTVPDQAFDDDKYMLAFIRHCLIQLAVHEVDEWFRYKGELVNDPHSDPFRQNIEDLIEYEPAWEPS